MGKDLSRYGSADYKSLSPVMKKTFVSVVNDHLDNLLREIAVPTLILWGKRDRETPPYMAKRIRRRVKNSRLVMLEGGHYVYIDAFLPCCVETEKFICSL
jgi:pimeloyl-ACP methyl ester carboxylesterase